MLVQETCLPPSWDNGKPLHIQITRTVFYIVINSNMSSNEVKVVVYNYLEELSKAIHSASKEAGCVPVKCFWPKPFGCPALVLLRDHNRFWYYVWTQAGKPRTGELFNSYKGIKKR